MNGYPLRIQRTRKKGGGYVWPPGKGNIFITNNRPIVYVGRPTKWGNPYLLSVFKRGDAVNYYRMTLTNWMKKEIKKELKGKNLACWCPLDKLCHADILLKIANKQ